VATRRPVPRARITHDIPSEFLLDPDHILTKEVTIDGASVDTGNTGQTNKLRKGLLMAKVTSTGKYIDYLDGEADGRGTAVGILMDEVNVHDEDGTDMDQIGVIVFHCYADADKVYGKDGSSNYITDLPLIAFET